MTIANPLKRPDLAIVLVDEDGDATRYAALVNATDSVALVRVIGVAKQEFEAWLLGDLETSRVRLGTRNEPPHIEDMPPGDAKALLHAWAGRREDLSSVRRVLAESLRIEELQTKSRSFARLVADIDRAVRPSPA